MNINDSVVNYTLDSKMIYLVALLSVVAELKDASPATNATPESLMSRFFQVVDGYLGMDLAVNDIVSSTWYQGKKIEVTASSVSF